MKYSYMEIRLKINHKPRNKEYEKWIKEFIAKFNYEEMTNIKIIFEIRKNRLGAYRHFDNVILLNIYWLYSNRINDLKTSLIHELAHFYQYKQFPELKGKKYANFKEFVDETHNKDFVDIHKELLEKYKLPLFEDEKYYCQSNVNNLDLDFFYEYGY